jgi:ferric-dicitrate binding protein FerR (iron transport regulator)
MTRNERQWNDELAERELEILTELRDRVSAPDEKGPLSLYDSVLESAAKSQGRLRLVSPNETADRAPVLVGAPVPSTKWRWIGPLAAAAACVLVAFVWNRFWHDRVAVSPAPTAPVAAPTRIELVLASGEVRLGNREGEVGQGPLETGQHVSVGRGRACLNVDPSIDVCLDEDTEVALDSLLENDVRIRVVRGTAMAVLAPRAPGHTFSLVGGDVSATARGTMFAVGHSPAEGTTSVVVVEGKVEVSGVERAPATLSAHSRINAHPASKHAETGWVGRGDESRLLSLIAPRELWQTKEVGTLEVAAGHPGTLASIGQQPPLPLPLRTFVPAGAYRVLLRDPSGIESSVDVEIATGEKRRIEPVDPTRSPSRGIGASTKETAASLLDGARHELARGDRKAALALYQRLRASFPASPEAFTVLVTMGQIELDLKSPARALATFDAYLRRGGPLAPEALAGKIRSLRALGKTGEERAAIEEYLSRYPGGFDAPALKKRIDALSSP